MSAEAREASLEEVGIEELPFSKNTGVKEAPREPSDVTKETGGRGLQFWAVIAALCMTSTLAALENTVVATSLPVIVQELDMGHNYIWVTNIFFLTSAAVQPLFGQVANIFGRRWLAISIVAIFTIGSAICGAANSGSLLIFGRAVQGVGSGGINMIVDVIVSDLVPLRERGNFMGIILAVYSIGTSLGPFVGGIIVVKTTWRWVFLITLPFGGASIVLLFLSLHVKSQRVTLLTGLRRIDVLGNSLLIASSVSILLALSFAGAPYAWSSWRILVPLIVGFGGFILFVLFERSTIEPVIPARLFTSRTPVAIAINTFINSMLLYWVMFFLPVYFQAVLGSSPARTGVQMLPIILVAVPGAVVAVVVLSKYGRYQFLHYTGFAVATLGVGLFGLLDQNSSTAKWVTFQLLCGLGSGMVMNTLLPAFQASHSEADQAAATASWAFIRSFGNIWGVAIPAAIFNNGINALRDRILDEGVRQTLAGGGAYELGGKLYHNSTSSELRREIAGVYSDALRIVWVVAAGLGALAFLLVFTQREVKLRTELDTDYGLEGK